MRTSKFRHVYGSPAKKEHCFEGVRITKNAHDGSFCAVNPKFLAIVTESAGGGTFVVIQLENVSYPCLGKVDVCTAYHREDITPDIAFLRTGIMPHNRM